jgi:hypothetical protein
LEVTRWRSTAGGSSERRASSDAPTKVPTASWCACCGAQAHAHARAGHGFEEVENVRRARARQGGDGVAAALALHPQELAGGRHDGFHALALRCGDGGRAYSALMPLPTSAGVLGMVRTMRSEPSHWAMLSERMPAATLRCSARLACGPWLRGGVLEGLGLDGPDHDARALQRRAGLGLRLDAVVLAQRLARLGPGLDHLDLAGRQALVDQPANDGAGHVAAADEGDVLPDAYFSATKLAWLLDQVPGARARADRGELAFGTVDSWLVWKLTGGRVHATDASNASRTLLFNLQTLRWDPALLRLFDIPASVLPQVVPSSGVLGETEPALLGAPVPIAGLAGDQQAALFGQACFAPGMAKNTYGTGCFMLMNTGESPVPAGISC